MKEMWKKFIASLRCVNEEKSPECHIIKYQNRYSENIKHFPIHGTLGDEDIIQVSHKLEDGEYETCYVYLKDLKEYIKS